MLDSLFVVLVLVLDVLLPFFFSRVSRVSLQYFYIVFRVLFVELREELQHENDRDALHDLDDDVGGFLRDGGIQVVAQLDQSFYGQHLNGLVFDDGDLVGKGSVGRHESVDGMEGWQGGTK